MEKEIFFIAAILSVLVFVIDISLLKYFKIAEVDFLNRSIFVPILTASMILMLIFSQNVACIDFCVGTMTVIFIGSILYQAIKNKSITTGIAISFFQNSIVLISVIPILLFLLILGY